MLISAAKKYAAFDHSSLKHRPPSVQRNEEHAVDDALRKQFVGFGRGLLQDGGAYRLADIGRHPAADAEFQALQIGKPIDRALGVVHDPRAVGIDRQQLHARVLVGPGEV